MKLWTIVLLFLVAGVESKPLVINIEAEKAILINAKTGEILFEKKAHQKTYPASLTKIATILYATELSPNLEEMVGCKSLCLRKMHKSNKIARNYQISPLLIGT